MVERYRQAYTVLGGVFHALADVVAVVKDVVVGKHYSLGEACCSRCVLHVGHIILLHSLLCLKELLVRHMLAKEHYLLGGEHAPVLLLSDVDHVLEEGEVLGFKVSSLVVVHLGHQSLGHGHVVVVPVAVGEAQGGYVRLLHKVFKLVELVHGVHCYKDCSDTGT